jgi:hypothetical protein
MFTPSDVEKVVYVVDKANAAATLTTLRNKIKSGAGTGLTMKIFLVGALLSALEGDGMVLTNLYDVLTIQMPCDWQVKLGIRPSPSSPPCFSQDSVDRLSVSLRDHLEYGMDSAPDLDPSERVRRSSGLMKMFDDLLDVTLLPTDSRYRSIDATGVWSWGNAPRRGGIPALEKEVAELDATGATDDADRMRGVIERMVHPNAQASPPAEQPASQELAASPASAAEDIATHCDSSANADSTSTPASVEERTTGRTVRKPSHDPDARSSGKTAKDGTTEWFYGYDLHLLVRVAEPGSEYAQEPNLIERFAVTPAGRDLVSASQDLIRRAQPWLGPERIVIGDRAYSNLTPKNWYLFLIESGWRQVVDMRQNDQRWTDVGGMRITAGWPHCPATPDYLESIPKPANGSRADFYAAIEERRAWAHTRHTSDPLFPRFMCGGWAGTLRCPLLEDTLQRDAALPLVTNPPTGPREDWPDCCKQTTVRLDATDPNAKAKLWQKHYWGTPAQVAETDRRTSVEQVNGKMKASEGTCMSRGFVRVTGLARVTMAIGFIAVAQNIRALEAWARSHDDGRAPGHELLKARDDFVVIHLPRANAGQWDEFQAWRRRHKSA